ncbi:MAG: D-aminoacylase [Ilumatobacteraceae bacterium]|nr:D-aminoacylase [Ilumatobacteraceae bacterium]
MSVGEQPVGTGRIEIDAAGKAVAPGFIDAHTHDDRALLSDPAMACKVSQGVTTVITGNCGISLAPIRRAERPPAPLDLLSRSASSFFERFADYLDALASAPAAVNSVAQVGHSTLRVAHLANLERPATAGEIRRMRADLERSLNAGAAGLSTGLFYPPAQAASIDEVAELASGLVRFGGFHTTHMRDEGDRVHDSLAESFKIGRRAGVPVVISHHKCSGSANFGRSTETLAMLDTARASQTVGFDVYPYSAGSTSLAAGRRLGADRTTISWSEPHPEFAGRDLDSVAAELSLSVDETVAALSPAGGIFYAMDETDVQRIVSHPAAIIGSDGLPHDTHPHPRLWGTFPRVLGRYSRELGLFRIEDAVAKMTSRSATTFGIRDRGLLQTGNYADLVIFDPESVIDEATYADPQRQATGIELVVVNGTVVWQDRRSTGARPGRPLRPTR